MEARVLELEAHPRGVDARELLVDLELHTRLLDLQSTGNQQAINRQSTGNRQASARQSSGSHQAVIRQSSGNLELN
eukprot:5948311-Prymnesium_polylepis.2